MAWQRIEIDPNEPTFCGECLSTHLIGDMERAMETNPPPKRFPGRCIYCGNPTEPLQPFDDPATRPANGGEW